MRKPHFIKADYMLFLHARVKVETSPTHKMVVQLWLSGVSDWPDLR